VTEPARDLRPLAFAGVTAVVSVGLLTVAVATGGLGPDVGRGAEFCEAARSGWVRQPANTLSNAGFVVAGLLVAWRAGRREQLGATLSRYPGLATAYACVVVLLGPASAAMHATQSALGGQLDLLSMYLVASFAAAYAVTRAAGRGPAAFAVLFAVLLAGCELTGLRGGEVPVVMHPGNIAFGVLLVTALAVELTMVRRGLVAADARYAAVAAGALAVAFVIWNLSKTAWCDPHSPLQGHAVWHLLGAVAAYYLFRYYTSERSAGRVPTGGTPAAAPSSR
jgi:hypothetical protein